MKKRVAFKTLGCRLNQFETNAVASDFINAGYEVVDINEEADAYVVNTCTVTNASDHKSRQTLGQAARKADDAVVLVTGCMVNNHKHKIHADKRITYAVENDRKGSIFALLDSHFKGAALSPDDLKPDRFAFESARQGQKSRALVKIQDGCDNHCTFCIVPKVRGRAQSRPWTEIRENILHVVEHGHKEIVLTGVNIGRYDFEGLVFEDLVERILAIPGDFRVRISSIEPEGFGDKLLSLFDNPKLTPHLHLCLQSGSDKILLKMRRQYSIDRFKQIAFAAQSTIDHFNFTTDIIVGFPGEAEDDFKLSCAVAEEIGFAHIHTFKYSVRGGTRAERLPEQVPEEIKSRRSAIIRELSEKLKRNYRTGLIGLDQRVLVEKIDANGVASGYGQHYTPVVFDANERTRIKEFQDVRVVGLGGGADPKLSARPLDML